MPRRLWAVWLAVLNNQTRLTHSLWLVVLVRFSLRLEGGPYASAKVLPVLRQPERAALAQKGWNGTFSPRSSCGLIAARIATGGFFVYLGTTRVRADAISTSKTPFISIKRRA